MAVEYIVEGMMVECPTYEGEQDQKTGTYTLNCSGLYSVCVKS